MSYGRAALRHADPAPTLPHALRRPGYMRQKVILAELNGDALWRQAGKGADMATQIVCGGQ
jgi:hypothetical protein